LREKHAVTPEVHRPQRSGLSTKILVFVFCSACALALLVSGLAVHTLYEEVSATGARDLRRAAQDGARAVAAATPETKLPDEPSADERRALEARLAEARPEGIRQLLLLDSDGVVRAAVARAGVASPERLPMAGTPADPQRYRDAEGSWVVVVTQPVGASGFSVAAEAYFQEIHAPVLASFSRLFIADLCLVLLVSYLAYRVTSAAVRPIERLSEAARHIAQGHFDHVIPEPASEDEVGLLARTFNDMMRRLRGYQSEIEAANRSLMERNNELKQAKETFEQLSITDGLTKLHNHRFFQDYLTREIKRVSRTEEPLAILLVDIDDFKGLNDRFGHAAGDELLTGLARIMSDTVREADLLARYGGEEFVVLATNTDLEGAYQLAEKIRTNIAENSFIVDESMRPMRVTVSIGVAAYRGNRRTFFQAADRALYQAKADGKNCVVTEDEQGERA
jgi:diguanylate cyclase (GGDEF)-like protein